MCRLLGVLSPEVISSRLWLLDAERSLFVQSNASPETAQKDGWGIGWFDEEGRIHLQKGTHGAFEPREKEHYRLIAGSARSQNLIGHLRHASNPMNLPREQLLSLVNSQPFEDGQTLFGHNGSIPLPMETRKKLGSLDAKVQGVNDSEVLYWLIQKHYRDSGDPLQAFVAARQDLVTVWEENGRPAGGPWSGLNVLFAPLQDELWAFCCYEGEHGHNLCDDGQPYYQMSYQESPTGLVVGSEPFDSHRENWNALPNGQFLRGRIHNGRVLVEKGPLPVLSPIPSG
ncbi:MAG: class II glutamine amidotransferase [Thermoplasmata archaeon]